MPQSTPLQAWSVMLGTELPDMAAGLMGLGTAAEKQVNMRFASTAARDAAITPASARKAGMRAWIDALGYWTTVLTDSGSWVQESIRETFTGTEGTWVGSTPPAGTLIVRRRGTVVVGTSDVGGVAFSFTSAFSNGIVSCLVTPGDSAAGAAFAVPILANCGLSGWNGQVFAPGGSTVNSATVRLNYFAEGW